MDYPSGLRIQSYQELWDRVRVGDLIMWQIGAGVSVRLVLDKNNAEAGKEASLKILDETGAVWVWHLGTPGRSYMIKKLGSHITVVIYRSC